MYSLVHLPGGEEAVGGLKSKPQKPPLEDSKGAGSDLYSLVASPHGELLPRFLLGISKQKPWQRQELPRLPLWGFLFCFEGTEQWWSPGLPSLQGCILVWARFFYQRVLSSRVFSFIVTQVILTLISRDFKISRQWHQCRNSATSSYTLKYRANEYVYWCLGNQNFHCGRRQTQAWNGGMECELWIVKFELQLWKWSPVISIHIDTHVYIQMCVSCRHVYVYMCAFHSYVP